MVPKSSILSNIIQLSSECLWKYKLTTDSWSSNVPISGQKINCRQTWQIIFINILQIFPRGFTVVFTVWVEMFPPFVVHCPDKTNKKLDNYQDSEHDSTSSKLQSTFIIYHLFVVFYQFSSISSSFHFIYQHDHV